MEHALRQYQLAEPSGIQAVLHLAGAMGSAIRLVVLASKVPGALAKRWTSVMAPGSVGEMWPELPSEGRLDVRTSRWLRFTARVLTFSRCSVML
jgi:hypothetical protein